MPPQAAEATTAAAAAATTASGASNGDLPPGGAREIASGNGTELGSEPVKVSLQAPHDAPPMLDAAEAAGRGEGPRIFLHLDDVEADGVPGIVWAVHLDPDGAGDALDEPVGTVVFFGRGHAHGDDTPAQPPAVRGERFVFDITDVVQELEAVGKWDPNKLTVSFHPALPEGYTDPIPSVRIGRVFVTHG